MSNLKRWDGSAWVTVPDGSKVQYWTPVGPGYAIAQAVKYWNGSSWVTAWTRSDPLTLTFYPTFTTNIRWDGAEVDYDSNLTAVDNGKATLGLGRYNGEKPYHYTSLLKFDGVNVSGSTSLVAALAARPICKSASLRLYRNLGIGLQSPVGYLRMGTWSQLNAHTMPTTTVDGTYHDWSPTTVTDIYGWQRGFLKTFSVDPQNIYDLRDGKSLMFSEVTSGYLTSGGTTNAHSQIYGLNDGSPDLAKIPVLTVSLDVV